MQHDTSPHDAKIAGEWRRVQTAALVLCFSRLLFMQLYPTYTRFLAKVFLTEALKYMGGAASECMIDNTGVIVLHGTGPEMVPAPEMAAFAERYDFIFKAHKIGDANRSARVEGSFNFIENNFYAGREFSSFEHANEEARKWCDQINAAFSNKSSTLLAASSSRVKLTSSSPSRSGCPIFTNSTTASWISRATSPSTG